MKANRDIYLKDRGYIKVNRLTLDLFRAPKRNIFVKITEQQVQGY